MLRIRGKDRRHPKTAPAKRCANRLTSLARRTSRSQPGRKSQRAAVKLPLLSIRSWAFMAVLPAAPTTTDLARRLIWRITQRAVIIATLKLAHRTVRMALRSLFSLGPADTAISGHTARRLRGENAAAARALGEVSASLPTDVL